MNDFIFAAYGVLLPSLIVLIIYGVICLLTGVLIAFSWDWLRAIMYFPDDDMLNDYPPLDVLWTRLKCVKPLLQDSDYELMLIRYRQLDKDRKNLMAEIRTIESKGEFAE